MWLLWPWKRKRKPSEPAFDDYLIDDLDDGTEIGFTSFDPYSGYLMEAGEDMGVDLEEALYWQDSDWGFADEDGSEDNEDDIIDYFGSEYDDYR